MGLKKQIGILILTGGFFLLFDAALFFSLTKRCLPQNTEGRSAKTIDVDRYLPFEENSRIYKANYELPLSGELPVLDGAEGLYPVFSAFVNAYYPKESVEFDGKNFSEQSKLQMNNTLRAYKAVVDGTSDIVFCAAASKEQLAYAEASGVELVFVPIGRDAFVFLVSKDNPVDDLTAAQLRGIYGGDYTNWKELGGKNALIHPVTRIAGSGSQTALLSFLGDTEIKRGYFSIFGSPIGFSFRYYTEQVVAAGNIKMLSVNGVYPDVEHIKNGSYPLCADFYAIYRADNENPNIGILIDAILSEEGQEIIEKTGYVPIQ